MARYSKTQKRDDLGGSSNRFHEKGEMAPAKRKPAATVVASASVTAPTTRRPDTGGSNAPAKKSGATSVSGKVPGKKMGEKPKPKSVKPVRRTKKTRGSQGISSYIPKPDVVMKAPAKSSPEALANAKKIIAKSKPRGGPARGSVQN
jgi:hypothetical protein